LKCGHVSPAQFWRRPGSCLTAADCCRCIAENATTPKERDRHRDPRAHI
jgi:hypothetical protein